MAFRAVTTASGSATTYTIAVPAGLQPGDDVFLFHSDDGASHTPTFPAGFTVLDTRFLGTDGQNVAVAWKRQGATVDSGTYSVTAMTGNPSYAAQCVAFSGRDTSNPPVLTVGWLATGTGTTSVSVTTTALAGDDILFALLDDPTGSGTATFTAPTGESTAATQTAAAWQHIGTFYAENVPAGSTTVTGSISETANHATLGYLIRIPAAAGASPNQGTGSGTFHFAGAAVGATTHQGHGAGSFHFTGATAGSTAHQGSAAGAFHFTETATGATTHQGAASGGFHFTGADSGSAAHSGTAAGGWAFTGVSNGLESPSGTASGGFHFAGADTGDRTASGSATGGFAYAGSATGKEPGSQNFTGNAAGTFSFAGSATGQTSHEGTAAGGLAFAGHATGQAPTVGGHQGSATGTLSFAGAASGARDSLGTVAGTIHFRGVVDGDRTASGAATGTLSFAGTAHGLNGTTFTFEGLVEVAGRLVTLAEGDGRAVGIIEGAGRSLDLEGVNVDLGSYGQDFYIVKVTTTPAAAAVQASFDGGTTWVDGELVPETTDQWRWLLAGPLLASTAVAASATQISGSCSPRVVVVDDPQRIERPAPRIYVS